MGTLLCKSHPDQNAQYYDTITRAKGHDLSLFFHGST